MFEALNEFIAIIAGAAPWLLPFVVVLVWWGFANWQALNDPEKVESFTWAVTQLTNSPWEKRYLSGLGWVLDKVSSWIGDCDKLNQIYVTPANPKSLINKTFGFNPFTPESYDKCLRLAFLYPVLSFFITWAMGGDGEVGNVNFMGNSAATLKLWYRWTLLFGMVMAILASLWLLFRWRGWRQLGVLGAMLLLWMIVGGLLREIFDGGELSLLTTFGWIFLFIYVSGWFAGLLIYRSFQKAHNAIYSVALVFSFIVAVATAVANAVAIDFTIAFSGAIAVAFSGAATILVAIAVAAAFAGFSFTGAFAFLCAGIFIVLLSFLESWSKVKNKAGWFWFFYGVLFMVVAYVSLYYSGQKDYMVLVLFWLVLPLVNASLDWLSLGVTRGLLQAVRMERHGGWRTLGWGFLDLVFALVFLFLIATLLVLVTALGNVVSGKVLVDLDVIFTGFRANPWGINHWWVYFMMLSTLVPTLVHFALVGGAATLWFPQKLRERIAHNLEYNYYKISAAWVYLTFTPVIGFVVAPAFLMWLLYWLVTTNGGWLGGYLLDWAEWLALSVNPPVAVNP